ncbi:hypothetical protein JTE90_019298 [Oedothorax gibbosus]|uniref:Uncharacterized protein n=1 Tax=Oedothorax gibbosus TaxID=931172 RepID=A0AAV6UVM7_9ARAC|nr:hypothetical protein JTE90_019298 [Oedothorax gibbosus]
MRDFECGLYEEVFMGERLETPSSDPVISWSYISIGILSLVALWAFSLWVSQSPPGVWILIAPFIDTPLSDSFHSLADARLLAADLNDSFSSAVVDDFG